MAIDIAARTGADGARRRRRAVHLSGRDRFTIAVMVGAVWARKSPMWFVVPNPIERKPERIVPAPRAMMALTALTA